MVFHASQPRLHLSPKRTAALVLCVGAVAAVAGLAYFYTDARAETKQSQDRISTLEKDLRAQTTQHESTKKELAELKDTTGISNVDKDVYQSVFLKSGQVYFGKITKITTTQITLEDIYYLKVANGMELIKLGDEIHDPKDAMFLERQNVEFWENLKPDGQVAKQIKDYKSHN